MITHGVSAKSLRYCTVIPIPKDKRKNISVSDNYTAIALKEKQREHLCGVHTA